MTLVVKFDECVTSTCHPDVPQFMTRDNRLSLPDMPPRVKESSIKMNVCDFQGNIALVKLSKLNGCALLSGAILSFGYKSLRKHQSTSDCDVEMSIEELKCTNDADNLWESGMAFLSKWKVCCQKNVMLCWWTHPRFPWGCPELQKLRCSVIGWSQNSATPDNLIHFGKREHSFRDFREFAATDWRHSYQVMYHIMSRSCTRFEIQNISNFMKNTGVL